MDPCEFYNKSETCSNFNKYQYLITKTLKFLVPISLLSLLLSYVTGLPFMFSLNFSLLNFTFPPFFHALERKYMFLLCNGILAFLAKGLNFGSTNSACLDIELRKCIEDSVKPISEEEEENGHLEESVPEITQSVCVTDRDKTAPSPSRCDFSNITDGRVFRHEKGFMEERKNEVLLVESDDSEGEDNVEIEESGGSLIGASAGEAANEVSINTEELNKKFDEFIRKMKEEIRIEAQQQLIEV